MDTRTLVVILKTADLTKQKDIPATKTQLDNTSKSSTSSNDSAAAVRAKARYDRRLADGAKAVLHNAQQGHDDSKKARRMTRYAESQFPFLHLPAEVRNNVVYINI